jgi:hypothetical protein
LTVPLFLLVKQDTFFKLRPQQSIELEDNEKVFIDAGSTYELASYAYTDPTLGSFNGHIKFALKDASFQGLNTWFAFSAHVQVELDGEVVYPIEDQETIPVLWTTQDTIFKRRPAQSTALPPEELAPVEGDTKYFLHSYAFADNQGNFANHVKVTLRYEQDYINGLNTWFVYEGHCYVEYDGEVVYPLEGASTPILRVTQNTVFKRLPVQSSELPPDQVFQVRPGQTWRLQSYAYRDINGGNFNNHIKFAFKYPKDAINGFNTWYAFNQHVQIEMDGRVVYPPPQMPPVTPPPAYSGIPFKLPGNVSTFYTDQPIIPGGSFTWGEATKNATRIPETETIVNYIIALARQLQIARDQLRRPFQVNSWYRPPAVNAAVGGASRSYHLSGRAADVEVSGLSGRQVANLVFSWWPGGIGIYSHLPNVVHLDIGPRRTWGL